MMGRAGLGCFVEAPAELELGFGLLTQAGAKVLRVGALGGEGEVTPSIVSLGSQGRGTGGWSLGASIHPLLPHSDTLSTKARPSPLLGIFRPRRSQLSKQIVSVQGSWVLCLGKELGVTQELGTGNLRSFLGAFEFGLCRMSRSLTG